MGHCKLLFFGSKATHKKFFMKIGRHLDMSVSDQSFTIYRVNVHLSEMELLRKFKFFRIFHLKKNSSGSEFYMKNVFFWSTLCKSSSKIKNVGGGLISCNFSLIAAYEPPSQFHNFLATSTWCTSKEHIFHVEFRYKKKKIFLFSKIWQKSHFVCIPFSYRFVM